MQSIIVCNSVNMEKKGVNNCFPGNNSFLCRRYNGLIALCFLFTYLFFVMNIYVGNLNYRVKEADLQQVMEDYGSVSSVKVVTDRETGRSKGFGFVEMDDEQDGAKAIAELNGAEFEGRTMVVKEARPRF